jgi:hypothetical protein
MKTVKSSGQHAGIFGVDKPVATKLKVAGGAHGFDAFTSSISMKRGAKSDAPTKIGKKIWVGSGGGRTGAGTGK